jgi:uncharacterized protein YndB with AHSA1/START domain
MAEPRRASTRGSLACRDMDVPRDAPVIASSEATIDAPAEIVWDVLADLEHWPEWNPNVKSVEVDGPVAPGTVFRWKAGPSKITSTLRSVERPSEIGWTGKTLGARAVHAWSFESRGDGTVVRTTESFEGLVPRVFRGRMKKMLMNTLGDDLRHLEAEAVRRARKAPAGTSPT